MPEKTRKDWKELAQKAANERDPKRLLAIVEELNQALEERENQLRRTIRSTPKPGGNRFDNGKRFCHVGRNGYLIFVDDEPSIRLTLPPLLACGRVAVLPPAERKGA